MLKLKEFQALQYLGKKEKERNKLLEKIIWILLQKMCIINNLFKT